MRTDIRPSSGGIFASDRWIGFVGTTRTRGVLARDGSNVRPRSGARIACGGPFQGRHRYIHGLNFGWGRFGWEALRDARWKERGGQVGGGLDPQHPAERAEEPARSGRRGHEVPQLRIVRQHGSQLRGVARPTPAHHRDHPAEPIRHSALSRRPLPLLLGLRRWGTRWPGTRWPRADRAGDKPVEPPHHAADVAVEQRHERRHERVPCKARAGGGAQRAKNLGQPLRQRGRRASQRRPWGENLMHQPLSNGIRKWCQ